MVKISNVYYMLAYAFRAMGSDGFKMHEGEEFKNLHGLFAEIIIKSLVRQLKRGLPGRYAARLEELERVRGRVDVQASVKKALVKRHRLICEFDEFTVDTAPNRLIKCAVTLLLRLGDVSAEQKHYLKFLWSCLKNISDAPFDKEAAGRGVRGEYGALVNICAFLLEGLLMGEGGGLKLRNWFPDEKMSYLYERFLLEYFRRHHPKLNPRSAHIKWNLAAPSPHVPNMKSDVNLSFGGKALIVDGKYYRRTFSEYFGKKMYHSHNLYQIYSYVKNFDTSGNGSVSGMLLYAKTDEDITPDEDMMISGNSISVKTLDLTRDFAEIRSQLEKVASRLY